MSEVIQWILNYSIDFEICDGMSVSTRAGYIFNPKPFVIESLATFSHSHG